MFTVNLGRYAKENIGYMYNIAALAVYHDGPFPSSADEVDIAPKHMTVLDYVELYNNHKQMDFVEVVSTVDGFSANVIGDFKPGWPNVYEKKKWRLVPDRMVLDTLVGADAVRTFRDLQLHQLSFGSSELSYLLIRQSDSSDAYIEYQFDTPVTASSVEVRQANGYNWRGILEYHDGNDWVEVLDSGSAWDNNGDSAAEFPAVTSDRFRLRVIPINSTCRIYKFKLYHTDPVNVNREFTPTGIQFIPGQTRASFQEWGLSIPWFMVEAGAVGSDKPAVLTTDKVSYSGTEAGQTSNLVVCNLRVGEVPDAL